MTCTVIIKEEYKQHLCLEIEFYHNIVEKQKSEQKSNKTEKIKDKRT